MNRLINLTHSLISSAFPTQKQPQPTIDSYGQQSCGLSEEQIQSVIEDAECFGTGVKGFGFIGTLLNESCLT